MITKFSVSNFKGFDKEFTFDLQQINGYAFNKESIKNGVVNNALVYGHNGVGKTNLGLAMFDIIGHLTDKYVQYKSYSSYLNALNGSSFATFRFEFKFGPDKVSYEYIKEDIKTTILERFEINGTLMAQIDRKTSNKAVINFIGAETLNKELTNKNLSLLKYIKNNTQLDENEKNNNIFLKFFDYLDSMLFFRCLDHNMFLGLETEVGKIGEDIIERGNVKDLENFLNKAGIECRLKVEEELDRKILAFDFKGKTISFYEIASTGTKSLTLFYFWLQRLRESTRVKFVFIDEFDAFYHHELSALIVEELKRSGVQFILTTHNTSIITNDLLRPDCYFLMDKESIRSLSKSTQKELREAHNIEKMYKAGSFDVQ